MTPQEALTRVAAHPGGQRERLTVVRSQRPEASDSPQPPRPDPRPDIIEFSRPWGDQIVLSTNEASTVKILTVNPGCRLSLQRHAHRDEMWVILDEGVHAVVGSDSCLYPPGSQVWVPRGTVHRLKNQGSSPARVLEISYGDFDECDIERLEDDFDRV